MLGDVGVISRLDTSTTEEDPIRPTELRKVFLLVIRRKEIVLTCPVSVS
jgi:hypothetical protein